MAKRRSIRRRPRNLLGKFLNASIGGLFAAIIGGGAYGKHPFRHKKRRKRL